MPHTLSRVRVAARLALALVAVWGGRGVVDAAAQAVGATDGAYQVQHWTVEDGLPVNHVTSLAQTPDGYVWVATWDGLARFDGLDFDVFNVGNTPELPGNRVMRVQVGLDGTLWAVTEGNALVRYRAGRFENVSERHGFRVLQVLFEGDTTWLATSEGLHRMEEGVPVPYRPDVSQLHGDFVVNLVRAADDALWFTVLDYGLVRIDPEGEARLFPQNEALARLGAEAPSTVSSLWSADVPGCLHRSPEGEVWFSTRRGILRWRGAAFEALTADYARPLVPLCDLFWKPDGTTRVASSAGWLTTTPDARLVEYGRGPRPELWFIAQDAAGALWHLRSTTLYRDDNPIFDMGNASATLLTGQDGSLWLGNSEGLHRVRRAALETISYQEGLLSPNVYQVLPTRDGSLWAGSWSAVRDGVAFPAGLSRIEEGRVTTLNTPGNLNVGALAEGADGRLRVGTARGVWAVDGDAFIPVGTPSGPPGNVQAIRENGARWWAGSDQGLFILEGDTWRKTAIDVGIMAIVERRGGGFWLGTAGGGLGWTADGTQAEWVTTDDGLSSNNVRDVYEDERGVLWVATQDLGLCRLEPTPDRPLAAAMPVCLTSDDGLYDDSLHRILPDAGGRLWISSNRGLFWADRDQLDAFAQGTVNVVTTVSYTEKDGMRNREANGGRQPAGSRTPDGRLWFPTQEGVVFVDPSAVGVAEIRAPTIERVDTPDSSYVVAAGAVRLPARTRDVTVRYTAVAFDRPEDVRFRIRLVGYDDAWREVGRQRQATYTNLPPGTYRFEVQSGVGGQWSTPSPLTLRRPPLWWEARWVQGMVAFLILGLVLLAFRYRLAKAHRRELALQREVRRRTAEIQTQKDELARQADALHALNEAKDRFVANISHEFRTPLTLTFGPLDDALDGAYDSLDEARPHFQRARRNGHRLLRLVNQLLDLARLEKGGLDLALARRDLVAFVTHRVALFESVAEAQGVSLQVHTERSAFPFVFDAEKVETMLVNLLSNALKFTPSGGAVEVTLAAVAAAEGGAVLTVRDTGDGIAADHLPHVFDRFYQVDASATRKHEGAGIGLALVEQLVQLHGGTIHADSTLGKGTTFTVTLPALQAPDGDVLPDETLTISTAAPAEPTAPPPEPVEKAEEKPLVLVVEDNADMRALLGEHLAREYRVEHAGDGEDGLYRALDLVPDVVVSDVMMPRRDGFDLLAALKADVRTSHVPVVLLTARADAESRLEGLGRGADGYLAKPFARLELLALLRNLIDGRNRLRARWQAAPGLSPAQLDLPSEEQVFLEQVQGLVEEHMSDQDFGANELADALAMSPRQLRRKLGQVLGETPGALVRRFRIERAGALLAQRGGSIKEVVAETGFRSASGFRTAFREVHGCSPSEYARQYSESEESAGQQ